MNIHRKKKCDPESKPLGCRVTKNWWLEWIKEVRATLMISTGRLSAKDFILFY